ncbi:cholinephosphotransferase 1 [Coniochaeta sp. 2T2.1]|nr:cholinephosphotransferase 1 [Coniochaeta sp. 2T2.1]
MATAKSSKRAVAECVSEDALVHLKSYQYSAVDKSPISHYILRPYWNACVEFLPLWLAPNMVTLIGFMFILGNVILLAIFMPDLVGPGPTWLYYSFAFGLFMYQTMDNIDGKQARRTGTSSGLGELFDHGIDSLNCTLASLLECAAMGLGTSKSGVFTALCPCLPMFFSTWETYHSHTLYLGVFNGPTEGILIACLIMALSGYYGPGIWTTPLVHILGEHNTFGWAQHMGDLSFRDIWIAVIVGSLLVGHVPFCIYHVVKARRERNLPVAPVFLEWTPMAVFSLSIGAWMYSPYSTLREENHLVLFCLTMAFVFGRMTTKMILAHLTRQPFPYWTVMLWPLVGGALLGNLPRFGWPAVSHQVELGYLWAYFFFSLVVYSRWAWLVTTSICDYLGINCLTIPHDKQVANARAAKGLPVPNGRPLSSNGVAANGKAGAKKD